MPLEKSAREGGVRMFEDVRGEGKGEIDGSWRARGKVRVTVRGKGETKALGAQVTSWVILGYIVGYVLG